MVWLYYGNPSANSASNDKATFELFDDFNDGIIDPMWRVYTNASETSGVLTMVNTGEVGIETYVNPPLSDFAVKMRIDIATETYPAGSRIRIWGQNWIPFEYKYWWGSWRHKGFFTYNYNTEINWWRDLPSRGWYDAEFKRVAGTMRYSDQWASYSTSTRSFNNLYYIAITNGGD